MRERGRCGGAAHPHDVAGSGTGPRRPARTRRGEGRSRGFPEYRAASPPGRMSPAETRERCRWSRCQSLSFPVAHDSLTEGPSWDGHGPVPQYPACQRHRGWSQRLASYLAAILVAACKLRRSTQAGGSGQLGARERVTAGLRRRLSAQSA